MALQNEGDQRKYYIVSFVYDGKSAALRPIWQFQTKFYIFY